MALFARSAPRVASNSFNLRVSVPRAQTKLSVSRLSNSKRGYASEIKPSATPFKQAQQPAQSSSPAAMAAAEAATKVQSYKELLTKRDQRTRDIVAQIGPVLDSTEAAEQAQQWFWLAFSEKKLSQVEQDLAKIEEFASKNKDFGTFLTRGSLPPQVIKVEGDNIPAGAKVLQQDGQTTAILPNPKTTKDLLNDLVNGARVTDVTARFLETLESTGNLKDLRDVIEKFRQKSTQRAQGTGVIEAVLTVASTWSEADINKVLNQFLERNPQYKGSQIKLQTKVDPSIMGGFKLKIADRFVDKSERIEYEKAVKQQELQTTAFYQKLEEAAVWQPHVYWPGPYANDSEYLEAMEDKYGDDTIEAVRSWSADQFEKEISAGLGSSFISSALEFAQPPRSLERKMSNMIYYKSKDVPRPNLDELIADFQKVRNLPSTTPRL